MEVNKTCIQFFDWYTNPDGNHWNRFAVGSQRLAQLGFTAAWLPPAYKGTRGDQSEGYDVYDIYDLGEFDQKGTVRTRYGTKENYIRAIDQAKRAGLEVYVDVVLNHMGGAEKTETMRARKTDPEDRTLFLSEPEEITAYTRFEFPGRAGRHSNFVWDHTCFTGIDHCVNSEEKCIYKIINDHQEWQPVLHEEKGNFDYLMLNDIDTRNPRVREELKRWLAWYYDTVPFDGVRLDAVKHMDPGFFNEWLDYARKIKPGLFALGEFWLSDDLPVLWKYLDAVEDRMWLFDAPLHHNLSIASNCGCDYDLRTILHETLVSTRPANAMTFVDNHDTQPLQSLEEFTEQWFKPHAYALILLREHGYPCVFYPDIYGSKYSGKNKKGQDVEIVLEPVKILPTLLLARKHFAYGEQRDYFDQPDCIGWVRRGLEKDPACGCAVLVSTAKGRKEKRMSLGRNHRNCAFEDILSPGKRVTTDDKGMAVFSIDDCGVAVWVPVAR